MYVYLCDFLDRKERIAFVKVMQYFNIDINYKIKPYKTYKVFKSYILHLKNIQNIINLCKKRQDNMPLFYTKQGLNNLINKLEYLLTQHNIDISPFNFYNVNVYNSNNEIVKQLKGLVL